MILKGIYMTPRLPLRSRCCRGRGRRGHRFGERSSNTRWVGGCPGDVRGDVVGFAALPLRAVL